MEPSHIAGAGWERLFWLSAHFSLFAVFVAELVVVLSLRRDCYCLLRRTFAKSLIWQRPNRPHGAGASLPAPGFGRGDRFNVVSLH